MSDTGWDLLNLDPALVARYYASVPGATLDLNPGTWTFPCSAPLPDLVLSIGGVDGVVIEGRWLNYHPWDADGNCKLPVFLFVFFLGGIYSGGWGGRKGDCEGLVVFPLEVADGVFLSFMFLASLHHRTHSPLAIPAQTSLSLRACPSLSTLYPSFSSPSSPKMHKKIQSQPPPPPKRKKKEKHQLTPSTNRLHRRAPTHLHLRPRRLRTGVSDGAVRGV